MLKRCKTLRNDNYFSLWSVSLYFIFLRMRKVIFVINKQEFQIVLSLAKFFTVIFITINFTEYSSFSLSKFYQCISSSVFWHPSFPDSNKRELRFLQVKEVHLNNLGLHYNSISKFISDKTWLMLIYLKFGRSKLFTMFVIVLESASKQRTVK